jgi:hypothetical protein
MTSRILFSAVALATLSLLTACGGGDAADDNVANQQQASSVGGIGGSGLTGQSVGGIGGSGLTTQSVGGIGGSGLTTQSVGGIGGSGLTAQSVGGIGGSGLTTQSVGGIGGSGIQSIALAHACSLQSVNVTIAGARVNANGAADLGSPGWVDVPVAAPVRTDLLKLAAGGALPLDFSALPDGTYRQIRLLLVADDAATPLANSVVAAGSQEIALSVPAATDGGLPLAPTITVAQGQVTASFRSLDVCTAVSSTAGIYALDAVASSATQVASAY